MNGDMLFVFGLLLVTVLLFVSDRVRLDVVAVSVILVLMLSGLLTPGEALAGFGDPVVLLIAGLFVVGEGLYRTGIAFAVGEWLMRVAGTNELRLLVMLMLVVAGLSAFMSSTGAVAIFIPIVLGLAAKAGISPSRLLLPIALASLMGGMLTLIGTPPNLVVSVQLEREGLAPFGFFSFTPSGLLVLATGIGYMLVMGRHLLPAGVRGSKQPRARHSIWDLAETYGIKGQLRRLRLAADSQLVGNSIEKAMLLSRYQAMVVGIERNGLLRPALSNTQLESEDILLVVGSDSALIALRAAERLTEMPLEDYHFKAVTKELGLVEVLLTPTSELIGHSLIEANFREHHDLIVLGIQRMGQPLEGNFADTSLAFGDSLLMAGGWRDISRLQEGHDDFLVLNLPKDRGYAADGHGVGEDWRGYADSQRPDYQPGRFRPVCSDGWSVHSDLGVQSVYLEYGNHRAGCTDRGSGRGGARCFGLPNPHDRGHRCLCGFRYPRGFTGEHAGPGAGRLPLYRFCEGGCAVADPRHDSNAAGGAGAVSSGVTIFNKVQPVDSAQVALQVRLSGRYSWCNPSGTGSASNLVHCYGSPVENRVNELLGTSD
jgi:di/tricarboxylate transporter